MLYCPVGYTARFSPLQLVSMTSGGSVASSHSEDAVHGPALVQNQNGRHGCSDTESRRKTINHGPGIDGDRFDIDRYDSHQGPRLDRIAGFTNKIAGGALAVAGLALYGKAVADVFSSNASILDKAAVVTSILPGISCAVQLAADKAERGHASATHTALCFTQDALLVAAF